MQFVNVSSRLQSHCNYLQQSSLLFCFINSRRQTYKLLFISNFDKYKVLNLQNRESTRLQAYILLPMDLSVSDFSKINQRIRKTNQRIAQMNQRKNFLKSRFMATDQKLNNRRQNDNFPIFLLHSFCHYLKSS